MTELTGTNLDSGSITTFNLPGQGGSTGGSDGEKPNLSASTNNTKRIAHFLLQEPHPGANALVKSNMLWFLKILERDEFVVLWYTFAIVVAT